jgi:general stress protein 26
MGSILDRVKDLLKGESMVYLATVDEDGLPHMAAAEGAEIDGEGRLCFGSWFCRKTMENLRHNPRVSVALMGPSKKEGYQLMGRVAEVEQAEVTDGYAPDSEEAWSRYPQTRYKLVVYIEQVMDLSTGPHSDIPIA